MGFPAKKRSDLITAGDQRLEQAAAQVTCPAGNENLCTHYRRENGSSIPDSQLARRDAISPHQAEEFGIRYLPFADNLAPFPQSTTIGPFTLTFQSYGGDRTGAVLLSPFLKPGTIATTPFNHFSLLKSLEDIFDTDEYLGYAGQPGLVGLFGAVRSDIQTRK